MKQMAVVFFNLIYSTLIQSYLCYQTIRKEIQKLWVTFTQHNLLESYPKIIQLEKQTILPSTCAVQTQTGSSFHKSTASTYTFSLLYCTNKSLIP